MKLCKVSDIVGNEKLARPIVTSSYQELLAAGTLLKPEYVPRILQLGITEVFIEDESISLEEVAILREDVEDLFKEKVRSVMERHIYSDSNELEELSKTAENIISNILENDELVGQIYDIRERNADIYEHSISVCAMAVLLSLKLSIDKDIIHDIGVASLFHDIGLRYLEFDYTNVDIEAFDDKKKKEYKKHPAYAFSAMEHETWISDRAKKMVLSHHEHSDGSGYPLHAKGCSEETQILQVCDVFDEMICGIGCKRSRVYEAVEYLKMVKEMYYSEKIVNTLLDFTAVYPVGTVVKLSSGELAVVIRQNKQFPERPVLRIVKEADGKTIDEAKIYNLLEVMNVFIEKVLM